MSYRLHPEAALEHEEQPAIHARTQLGFGPRYHGAMLHAVSLAIETPHRFKVARPPDIRQIRLLGFPFTVIYREVAGLVQGLAFCERSIGSSDHLAALTRRWSGRDDKVPCHVRRRAAAQLGR